MGTRIKVEAIYTVPDADVQTETDRLVDHLNSFRMASVRNSHAPQHDSLQVLVERRTWSRIDD